MDRCQFCGTDLSQVSRPAPAAAAQTGHGINPKHIWTAYYILSSFWVLGALYDIGEILIFAPARAQETLHLGVMEVLWLLIAIGRLAVGIGLLARVEFARGVLNVLAWLGVLRGLYWGGISLVAVLVMGPLALIGVVGGLIWVGIHIGIIWIIAETDQFHRH